MFPRHMAMTLEAAHEFARERGTSWVYAFARFVLTPIAKVWFRLKVTGAELVPADGPVIVAPNHKSIVDPFFVGLATKRRLHFMAKAELFEGRSARVLSGLGAFPVRRGTADPEALETSRIHLEKGRVIALFPEGTRHRDPEALRAPRRGAGRLAIESQAPIVPCAITGTERFPRPGRIQVAFAPAIEPAELEVTPQAAAELIENQVWPEVEREFRRLRANPGADRGRGRRAVGGRRRRHGRLSQVAQAEPPPGGHERRSGGSRSHDSVLDGDGADDAAARVDLLGQLRRDGRRAVAPPEQQLVVHRQLAARDRAVVDRRVRGRAAVALRQPRPVGEIVAGRALVRGVVAARELVQRAVAVGRLAAA